MLKELMKTLTSSRTAISSALDALDMIRQQIGEAKAELARIESAPQPVEDAITAFDAWAGRIATDAVDNLRLGRLLDTRTASGDYELPRHVNRIGNDGVAYDYGSATQTLLGLVVATSLPALREIVRGQLEDLTAGRQTMTPSERAKKLAAGEAELLTLELTEESAIRALEAAGVDVDRRPDADPRALLASDASLPS